MGGSAAFSRWLPVADEGPTLGNVFSAASSLYPTHLYTGFLKEFHHLNQTPVLKGTWWGRAFQFRSSNEAFSSKFAAAGLCYFNGGEGSKMASGNAAVSNSNPKSTGGTTRVIRSQLTSGLIAANVLTYMVDLGKYYTLTVWGAKDNYWIRRGQLWRLVTYSFLHASPMHLLVNCWSLYNVGTCMETVSGPKRYLAVYFASAIGGSLLSYYFCKSCSVGASGAIFGLIGSYAVFVMRHREYMDDHGQKGLNSLAHVIAVNAVLGLLFEGIDNWSHLGGFLGGAAASWLLGPAYKYGFQTTADGKRIYVDRPPISHFVKIEVKQGAINKKSLVCP